MTTSTPVDMHIGNQLRSIRTIRGLTQESIGAFMDISFQQVQKYEWGTNCIGADNLYFLAQGLKIPVEFFFEGLADIPVEAGGFLAKADYSAEDKELLSYFHKIPSKSFRNALIALLEAMADGEAVIKSAESHDSRLQPLIAD